ncbi:uncharacterized protein LOC106129493 isoform X2 [Amyelois transitella]|uniref:uncharacterized protein LOC106129493 isoform X2 n=1 Tax=Amyelois transitella TaxID=680683 RepID=UPI00067D8BEC|nr:uncharacterized protein LOC106129493 isoform X2 [Amyelois transitella]
MAGLDKADMEKLEDIINSEDPLEAKKKLIDILDSDELSEEVKGQLRSLLYGNAPFLGSSDRTTGTLVALALTAVVFLVIFFFGYKLYKSIKEKEKKKEEKKKAKQMKKKK